MLVFWNEKLVLLAVPKTGTQAFERALGPRASIAITDPPELKHAPLYRYNRFFRPMFDKTGGADLELAAVIREPFSWLGSWYRYRQRLALDGLPVSTRGITYDAFLRASCRAAPPAFANVGSQAKFTEPRPNGTRVAHFFRYEDQDGYRAFLAERLGALPDIPRINVSPARDLSIAPETEALVRRVRAADFALWASIPVRGT
ncbi:gamma-glutamyl kinase [Marivita sp. GX14005]|uniref:gamma-glutamyl kinase n=1 Tax=Marivita sp. GX14005 TaxID=2942276 RepID=UPI00201961B8|nr:gamma-glutamyl kinase [Marivita sp. GX14005]MCL3883741.1 gamma-glutamyl kinase [Marivita sp. GX14005]